MFSPSGSKNIKRDETLGSGARLENVSSKGPKDLPKTSSPATIYAIIMKSALSLVLLCPISTYMFIDPEPTEP